MAQSKLNLSDIARLTKQGSRTSRDIAGVGAPRNLADVDFAIVRASFAVAETGSVLLSDADLRVNSIARGATVTALGIALIAFGLAYVLIGWLLSE
jgi:hypothetical protein